MVCFNFYIFDRKGICLYYHEWYRPKSVKQGAGTLIDDQKQMFGLFWTLNNFTATVDPREVNKPPLGTPRKIGQGCKWYSFTTNTYKLHFLESPSGIKMVLNTSPDVGDLREVMSYVYDDIYVEYVVKNPLYTPGEPFKIEQFNNALNGYLRSRSLLQSI
eukprot:GHRR01003773.1.p1 GENE.GHRR01003773.1~~GHRR01003773.1.p1  ORF type:complete len:160 (+),score=34.65 GHRR01003773.1:255-734(+)